MAVKRKLLKRRELPGQARYLTFSCYQRLPLFLNDKIKQAFLDRLEKVHQEQQFKLFAWVVMPEHVHLLVAPNLPQFPVKTMMHAIKRPFAEGVIRRWKELDARVLSRITDPQGTTRFWQAGGGYDRNMFVDGELEEKINYIHNNPVARGLVDRIDQWNWSSVNGYTRNEGKGPQIDSLM